MNKKSPQPSSKPEALDVIKIRCQNCGFSAYVVETSKCPKCGWLLSEPVPPKNPPADKKPKSQRLLGTSLKEEPRESRASLEERLAYLKRIEKNNKNDKKRRDIDLWKIREEIKKIQAAIAELDVKVAPDTRAEVSVPAKELPTETPEPAMAPVAQATETPVQTEEENAAQKK